MGALVKNVIYKKQMRWPGEKFVGDFSSFHIQSVLQAGLVFWKLGSRLDLRAEA